MPWSSNATFLVNVTCGDESRQAIYKPLRGERPLWDFEPGLHRREVAAYLLSEALGLDLVPPTVMRDGPLGEGSRAVVRRRRPPAALLHDPRGATRPARHGCARSRVFDLLANNTDRKSGHVLIDADDHIWGIDHGLCFAADFKLRTVIWEFGGEPIDRRADRRGAAARRAGAAGRSPRCWPTTRSRRCRSAPQWVRRPTRVFPVDRRPPLPLAAGVSDDRRPRPSTPTSMASCG